MRRRVVAGLRRAAAGGATEPAPYAPEFDRFGPAFERAALGLTLVALDGTVLRLNQRLCEIAGYSREELLLPGKFLAITHPDDQPADIARRATMASGDIERFAITKRYVRGDGGIVWITYTGSLLRDQNGVPEHYLGIVEDITERKRIETALRESEERLRLALQAGGLGVREIDLLTGNAWSSPEAEAIFGRDDERDRTFEGWFAQVHPEDQPTVRASWERARATPGVPLIHEYRFHRPDGQWRWISAHARLDFIAGQPVRTIGVIQDISDRKATELALRRLTETLEARVREEIAARETAQTRAAQAERLQALGQLAGGIAHDFNNVLQAVMGALRLIERRPADHEQVRRMARLAGGAVERGTSITRRLLTFGQRGALAAESIDAADLLRELREILTHTLGATIEVRLAVAPATRPLLADRGQLETVLVNLATNARDAMPDGGTLTLSAEPDSVAAGGAAPAGLAPGAYVRLSVADTGVGMDPATLARAREPFFTTKRSGSGTGLGLAMAQGFAEQSGGALAIDSRRGGGTTVTLWLPEAEPRADTDAPRARPTPDTDHQPHTRILLVDDEPMIREVLARQLAAAGFAVLLAEDGAAALELGAREVFDAVVTDLSMPGIDGLAVIQGLQAQYPAMPAVLLTGYAGDETALAISGAMSGTFSLLRKPVTETQLIDRLNALLAARPSVGG